MWGQGGVDTMNGNAERRRDARRHGADTMNGDAGDDEMYGDRRQPTRCTATAATTTCAAAPRTDTMDGDAGNDEMYGDGEVDIMRGGGADDLMRGGSGDDKMEGNGNELAALPLDDAAQPARRTVNSDLAPRTEGVGNAWTATGGGDGDVIYGDAGQDDIVGGSQGTPAEPTAATRSSATPSRTSSSATTATSRGPAAPMPDGTTTRAVALRNPGTDGGARLHPGQRRERRRLCGRRRRPGSRRPGRRLRRGQRRLRRRSRARRPLPVAAIGLYGDTGQDDLIGGTSQGDGGVADGADDIWGGQGADVVAGDNADLMRPTGSDCPAEPNASAGYDCNTFRVGRRPTSSSAGSSSPTSPRLTPRHRRGTAGGDTIGGQDGHDRLYGQGGGDWIEGGGNDDFAFGNADIDTIFGGDGQDDLSAAPAAPTRAGQATATDGRLDAGDIIHGEGDFDAIAGDNSRMVRKTETATRTRTPTTASGRRTRSTAPSTA